MYREALQDLLGNSLLEKAVSSVSTLRRVSGLSAPLIGAPSLAVLLMRNACHARTRTIPKTLNFVLEALRRQQTECCRARSQRSKRFAKGVYSVATGAATPLIRALLALHLR